MGSPNLFPIFYTKDRSSIQPVQRQGPYWGLLEACPLISRFHAQIERRTREPGCPAATLRAPSRLNLTAVSKGSRCSLPSVTVFPQRLSLRRDRCGPRCGGYRYRPSLQKRTAFLSLSLPSLAHVCRVSRFDNLVSISPDTYGRGNEIFLTARC